MSESEFNSHRAVRKALDRAADLLMDHGIIRTGLELEQVCEQIRNLAPPEGRFRTRVDLTEFALMTQNNPRDFVIGILRDKGIPAHPGPPWAKPTEFGSSILVNRGLLRHHFDVVAGVHKFAWDEGVPF